MFNRRMLVALAACLAVSASSAMAGGGGGTKKNATLEVHNATENVVYAFVNISDAKIQGAVDPASPEKTLAAFKKLGGKQIEIDGKASFPVVAGDNIVTAVAIDAGNQQLVGRAGANVPKGTTSVVVIDQLFDAQG
ncbi:MAG: hypothetical protein ABI557_12140 [Aureliella sp.]